MRPLFVRLMLSISILVISNPALAQGYIGITKMHEIFGMNFETAGDWGGAFVVVGANDNSTGYEFQEDLTFIAGYRRYIDGVYDQSNFYLSFLAGDLDGTARYNRYGLGGELGYQWVSDHLRSTLSVSLAAVESINDPAVPKVDKAKPVMFFSYSVSMKK